ncbi:MAG: neutral zinc metallopeptidase [Bacteroidales bacterium]|nr:neutral zinc metallopeptidase [Bacteroidales bacterium]
MNLTGRRGSSNVEDIRGGGFSNSGMGSGSGRKMSGGKKGGCLTIIIAIIGFFVYLKTGDSSILNLAQDGGGMVQTEQVQHSRSNSGGQTNSNFTEKDVEGLDEGSLASFCSVILASTEDVWTNIFKQNGLQYHCPKMVIFEDNVNTACGSATSATGPFYCSGDQKLYLDLGFFSTMKRQLGAKGDFAFAYVIAHEVGHHIEYETGVLQKLHAEMNKCRTEAEQNKISVRIELLADFYAGIWGYYENKTFKSLEDGDIEEAIQCAHQIGDDYLQRSARGTVNAKEFTHGTSQQRMKWLKLGLTTGDISKGQVILTCPESQL